MQTKTQRAVDWTKGKLNHRMGTALRTTGATVFAALLWLGPAPSTTAQVAANSNPNAYLNAYMQNAYGQITLPKDPYGNSVFRDVVMLAMPYATGNGRPGSIDLTLGANQSFFLPLYGMLGGVDKKGNVEAFRNLNVFSTLDITFTIDGETVVTTENVIDYYSQFYLDPPIPFPHGTTAGYVWWQGISTLQPGLAPGQHVLKLDVRNTDRSYYLQRIIEYHNTWNLTIEKAGH